MKDVLKKLRGAYYTALVPTGVDVTAYQAKDGAAGRYIVYKPLTTVAIAQKSETTIKVQMQVLIVTEGEQYNSGDNADDLANQVYQFLWPTPGFVLNLGSDFEMTHTELISDTPQEWNLKDQIVSVDRTIVLEHTIYIR